MHSLKSERGIPAPSNTRRYASNGGTMYGCYGKILTVNLTDQTLEVTEFDEAYARKWIGGNGFIAEIVHRTVPPEADAFSPRNAVVFAAGPLNGSPLWGTGRGHLGGISPLTGYFADSNFGGDFAAALKRSGFDAVSIIGESATPLYLFIDNGEAELRDAGFLTGLDVEEAHEQFPALTPGKSKQPSSVRREKTLFSLPTSCAAENAPRLQAGEASARSSVQKTSRASQLREISNRNVPMKRPLKK